MRDNPALGTGVHSRVASQSLTPELLASILERYPLSPEGVHGVAHWARVLENGLRLAETTGADRRVVELFAVFHDAQRRGEGRDRGHGQRGAELAGALRGSLFQLPDAAFGLLCRACAHHTDARWDEDPTVQTCWDADRLDLTRVGIQTDPRRLCTAAARAPEVLRWAGERAARWHRPAGVLGAWGLGG